MAIKNKKNVRVKTAKQSNNEDLFKKVLKIVNRLWKIERIIKAVWHVAKEIKWQDWL